VLDALSKTIKNEGVAGLWVGLPTYYFRVAPHAMISILVQDYLHDFLDKGKDKKF
jgi:solute carrier family 25 (mitochondrial oxoglutarate transporter), member 11